MGNRLTLSCRKPYVIEAVATFVSAFLRSAAFLALMDAFCRLAEIGG
jgi:hypothetical protein